jgi:penicillin G amidase
MTADQSNAKRNPPLPKTRIRFGCLTALIAGAGLFLLCLNGYHTVISSLPDRAGKIRLSGLSAEVRVTRDGYGVPAISASNRHDLFFALGYVTAQDRLFQMELTRRTERAGSPNGSAPGPLPWTA